MCISGIYNKLFFSLVVTEANRHQTSEDETNAALSSSFSLTTLSVFSHASLWTHRSECRISSLDLSSNLGTRKLVRNRLLNAPEGCGPFLSRIFIGRNAHFLRNARSALVRRIFVLLSKFELGIGASISWNAQHECPKFSNFQGNRKKPYNIHFSVVCLTCLCKRSTFRPICSPIRFCNSETGEGVMDHTKGSCIFPLT